MRILLFLRDDLLAVIFARLLLFNAIHFGLESEFVMSDIGFNSLAPRLSRMLRLVVGLLGQRRLVSELAELGGHIGA